MTLTMEPTAEVNAGVQFGAFDVLLAVVSRGRHIVAVTLLAGGLGFGATYLIPKTYVASTTLMPAQASQTAAAAALSSLGALAGMVGGGGGRASAEQLVALMQSATVQNRLIADFDLDRVYDTTYRFETRKLLRSFAQITADRRSGLITISVEDKSPERAAKLANAHVEQLRKITSELAITEAQQRRAFFEQQLNRTRESLTEAQRALQDTGFTQSTLRAEPKSAADGYAKLLAELTSAEVRLRVLRGQLTDQTPEVQQQTSVVTALRAQIARLETAPDGPASKSADADYLAKYRNFKYQEALFELFARQYEAARVDESREGPLIQVVDIASPPEYKSSPKRSLIALAAAIVAAMLMIGWSVWTAWVRTAREQKSELASSLSRLRQALRGPTP
jgi:uncharacterized protein involved in exopolysaccharide biosynthesis